MAFKVIFAGQVYTYGELNKICIHLNQTKEVEVDVQIIGVNVRKKGVLENLFKQSSIGQRLRHCRICSGRRMKTV